MRHVLNVALLLSVSATDAVRGEQELRRGHERAENKPMISRSGSQGSGGRIFYSVEGQLPDLDEGD